MPFGMKNSGATFQRMMDKLFANVCNVDSYVNGVIVHSATTKEHAKHLETFMSLLRKHGLRVWSRK